jgi:RNA polymerase sigma-70 factor (ECF subfamily)
MQPDETLALNAQRGSQTALQELVERHHALLLGFLYRLSGGDRSLSEDLTQDAFLHVLRGLHSYRYPRPFKPWLYAIALNCTRDHYKRADTCHTLATPDSEADLDGGADRAPSFEEHLVQQGDTQELATALLALPFHQREVLLLRYCQDLSLADIAETLEIPVGTVKSRLCLGLRALKVRMKDDEQIERSGDDR